MRQACGRFLTDLERVGRRDFAWHLDRGRANDVCAFIEGLRHVKGKWARAGERIRLEDWQCFIVVNVFGWLDAAGMRRFRVVYLNVPRKNAKSTLAAAIGIAMLVFDGEFGAEVYSGATTEAQAWEVFRPARQMIERDPDLQVKYGVEIRAKSLVKVEDGGRFQPVIGNPGDGASPSCAIVDEYHEHKTSDLYDTMQTGMAAREQPLMLVITTAGADMGGPCYAMHLDALNVLAGTVADERQFAVVYTIDEKDRWDTIEAQRKANPNWGISVDPEFLAGQLAQARRSATQQAAYKTKHLNLWVGAKAAWMNMLAFQACRKKALKIGDFKGRRCLIGLDLASKVDIAAMGIWFPDDSAAFCRYWLPEATIAEHARYRAWHAEGWITATPGDVIDFAYIEDELRELRDSFEISDVPFDPFQATQFSTRMQEEGFPMVQYGATVKNFSEPMKELEAMIIKKAIRFEMDPVLMWMFGNVVAQLDKKDNIFPNKQRPENKIDGVVALIMAIGRHISREPEQHNPYDTADLMTVPL